MTFIGLVNGGVFCQDMGDLTVRNVQQLETVVKFIVLDADNAEISSFNESYYPNAAGELVISGLADLMAGYLEGRKLKELFNPNQQWTEIDSFATLKLEFYQQGSKIDECSQLFYQANNRTGVFPSSYKYFLGRFRERTVHEDQVLFLSYIYRGQQLQAGVAYYQANGSSAYRTLTLPNTGMTTGKTCCHQYIPADIANLCGVTADALIYIEFKLLLDGTTIDYMKCTFDHGHNRQKTAFLFKNLFGVPEMIVMTGVDKRTSELDASFSWINRRYRKTSTDLTTSHTICTGSIDMQTHDSVKDAIRSEEVYLVDGSQLVDMVTVTDIDLDVDEPRTKPMAVYITYRVSEKVQERFSRVAVRENEIFDDTFDDTFE